jgi:hypothetical protein
VTLRLDYKLTANQSLSASYAWNREYVKNIDADNINYLPTAPLLTDDNRNFLSLAWRIMPTQNFTNELRGGFDLVPITFARQGGLPPYLLDLSQLQADFNLPSPIGVPLLAGTEDKLYQSTASIDPLSNDWGDSRTTNTYNLQDNASWKKGRHFLQFGIQTQLIRDALSDSYNITPLDTFGAAKGGQATDPASALLAVLTGQFARATQTFNVSNSAAPAYAQVPSVRHFRYDNYAFYLQDGFSLLKNRLAITAGLRYELYPPVQETDGLALVAQLVDGSPIATALSKNAVYAPTSGGLYDAQHLNFAPSLGIAFDPTGHSNTVIRAGYAISYVNDDLIGAIDSTLQNNLGLVTTAKSGPDTLGQQAAISAPAAPSSFGLSNPRDQGQIGVIDPHLRVPYVQQWNIGVQQIVHGFLVDARYVGNHATGMIRGANFNLVELCDPGSSNCSAGFLSDFLAAQAGPVTSTENPFGYYYTRTGSTNPFGFLQDVQTGQAATAAAEWNALGKTGYSLYANPNAVQGATILGNYSSSTYNGLQLSVRRQLLKGVQVQASYTFSKVLSDSARTSDSAFEPYRDAAAPGLDRARAPFDLTHAIKGNFIYFLPDGSGLNGAARALFGGWSLSGIVTIQSGNPFSILSGYATVDNLTASLNTADLAGSLPSFGVTKNGYPSYFSSAAVNAFADPAAGHLGYLQQREFSGPWVSDIDLGIQKTVRLTEHQRIEIRGEALNVLNHASWLIGDQNINAPYAPSTFAPTVSYYPAFSNNPNPNFGGINSTIYPSRKVQLSVYYRF